jgi:hypothetical protein
MFSFTDEMFPLTISLELFLQMPWCLSLQISEPSAIYIASAYRDIHPITSISAHDGRAVIVVTRSELLYK